ncbi:unnamed protein product [Caenorhabditis brenneri]
MVDSSMMIDSSRLVMDNGNAPTGFTVDMFTRLTQRMVFEFLGGHARMEELPCLGDLADGNDEFHWITPSPTFSKSSQFKLLDSTGNLHLSSIVFMDLDFISRMVDYLCESVLLGSFDAFSTTFISSLEHFRSKLISQSADHSIEESHQCSPIGSFIIPRKISGLMTESLCDSEVSETQVFMKSDGFSNGIDFIRTPIPISSNQSDKKYSKTSVSKMAYRKDGSNIFDTINDPVSSIECMHLGRPGNNISTDESIQKFLIPDSKHLNEFLYGNLDFPMFLASELPDEKIYTFDYPPLHEDTDSVADKDVADLSDSSDSKFKGGISNNDKKTSGTPGVLIVLEDGSSSGEYKEMEISGPCNTELLATHWPTGTDSSFVDVSDHEELLENYGLNNQDEYNDIDYTCASPTWPGKVDDAWKEAIQMNLTDLDLNMKSLSSFYDENSETSVSSPYLNQMERAFNTSSSPYSSKDYLFQGHPFNDGFQNFIEVSIPGITENQLVYSIPNPDTFGDFLFGSLNSPTFLAAELQDEKVDILGSPFRACYSDHCAEIARSSDICNVDLLSLDSSSEDTREFPLDSSDYYELLESYRLNEQDQYTDDFICESPTWPGKI